MFDLHKALGLVFANHAIKLENGQPKNDYTLKKIA